MSVVLGYDEVEVLPTEPVEALLGPVIPAG